MEEFDISGLLNWGAIVALVLGISWVLRLKKLPKRARLMIPACMALSLLMFGFGQKWPVYVLGIIGALVVGLLIFDFAARASDQATREESR